MRGSRRGDWLHLDATSFSFFIVSFTPKLWEGVERGQLSFRDTSTEAHPWFLTWVRGGRFPRNRRKPPFLSRFHPELPKARTQCVITVSLHEVAPNLPCNYSVPRFDGPYRTQG